MLKETCHQPKSKSKWNIPTSTVTERLRAQGHTIQNYAMEANSLINQGKSQVELKFIIPSGMTPGMYMFDILLMDKILHHLGWLKP